MRAIRLRTEHMCDPIGLETSQPVLSWITDGGVLSAYQIIASVGGREVWDSGKVPGAALLARCGYQAGPAQNNLRQDLPTPARELLANLHVMQVVPHRRSFQPAQCLRHRGGCLLKLARQRLQRLPDLRFPSLFLVGPDQGFPFRRDRKSVV